jgi:hypothetical protein
MLPPPLLPKLQSSTFPPIVPCPLSLHDALLSVAQSHPGESTSSSSQPATDRLPLPALAQQQMITDYFHPTPAATVPSLKNIHEPNSPLDTLAQPFISIQPYGGRLVMEGVHLTEVMPFYPPTLNQPTTIGGPIKSSQNNTAYTQPKITSYFTQLQKALSTISTAVMTIH